MVPAIENPASVCSNAYVRVVVNEVRKPGGVSLAAIMVIYERIEIKAIKAYSTVE